MRRESTDCSTCGVPRELIKSELGSIGYDIEIRQCPSCQSIIRFAQRWPGWPWKLQKTRRPKERKT
jgi:hypothetical protein